MDTKTLRCVGHVSLASSFLENVAYEHSNYSDGCKQYQKQSELESRSDISNESCTTDDCDESYSDIEILRGDDDDDNDNNDDIDEEERHLEKEIIEKKRILKLKRTKLCSRLMAYKLMQFSSSADINNIYSNLTEPVTPETEFEDTSQVDKRVYSESPSSPDSTSTDADRGQSAAKFNENQISYGFTDEALMQMAIQASLEEYEKSLATANKSPPQADCSTSGFSDKAQTDPRLQNPSDDIPGSNLSFNPFTAVNPSQGWNMDQPKTEASNQNREAGTDIADINPAEEDFMEGDRYVGDKGKRPLSGKYSYKKRSKPSQADSDELPTGSSLPKKDRDAE